MIDWINFTPMSALAGGALIGAAAGLFALGNGRVAGIAGIAGGVLQGLFGIGAKAGTSARWASEAPRVVFLIGLLAAPWVWSLFAPLPRVETDVGWLGVVAAGLLVGIGTRMGNGCTSGHGVCGLSRLSLRSMVNVLAFMGAGMVTVLVLRHVL